MRNKIELIKRYSLFFVGVIANAVGLALITSGMLGTGPTACIPYILSKKSQLRLWNEPDKYYVGRVYQAPSLECLRIKGNRFTLNFVLEPFAYRNTITENFVGQTYTPNYAGTAPTPTYIVIENTGDGDAVNISITQSIKKE